MRPALIGLALATTATPQIAMAQAVQDDPTIVVQGQKPVEPKEAHRFIRQVVRSTDGQLARFNGPVCPLVIGLPPEYAKIVQRRIRANAEQAGIKTAPEDKCRANLVVMVADDADALVKALQKGFAPLFVGVSDSEMRRAMLEGPVHMWNTVQLQNDDGRGVSRTQGAFDHPTLDVRSASIINMPTKQTVLQSVMVVDAKALLGKTLLQIADYVAMRMLAGARPPQQGSEASTILTLFDSPDAAPPEMTLIDRSYLAGLYRSPPMGNSMTQIGAISRQIVRDSKERAGQ